MKKIFSYIFMVCLIVPAIFLLSACSSKKFTVEFLNEDGSQISSIQVEEGKQAICPITPTKEDDRYYVYEFIGWEHPDGVNATLDLNQVVMDLTVYACYSKTQPTYTVNFYKEDGEFFLTKSALRGNEVVAPSAPSKDADANNVYIFDAWVDSMGNEVNLEIIQSNLEVYAKYEAVPKGVLTLTFYDEDKTTLLKTLSVERGKDADFTSTKNIDENFAQALDHWEDINGNEKSIKNVQSDMVLYAVYGEDIVSKKSGITVSLSDNRLYYEVVAANKQFQTVSVEGAVNSISVQKIKSEVFKDFTNLSGVVLPDTILEIEANAFAGCTSLKAINMPGAIQKIGDSAFEGCTLISSIELPNTLVEIGERAFFGVEIENLAIPTSLTKLKKSFNSSKVTSVLIPDNINSIDDLAFSEMENLKTIIVTKCNKDFILVDVLNNSYIEELILADSITSLPNDAFYKASKIKKVTIPKTLVRASTDCFAYCTSLVEVNYLGDINDWVSIDASYFSFSASSGVTFKINGTEVKTVNIDKATKIRDFAFINMQSIETVIIGDQVEEIEMGAFVICKNIKTVTIGKGVKIMSDAFDGDENIEEVNYLGDINSWANINFGTYSPVSYSKSFKINGVEVEGNITIDKATIINNGAFAGVEKITSVTIGKQVKEIKTYAFRGCTNIEEINYLGDINEWVTINKYSPVVDSIKIFKLNGVELEGSVVVDKAESILKYAFAGIQKVTSIVIGNQVETIGDGAFKDCVNLSKINLPSTLTAIPNSLFSGCTSLKEVEIPSSVKTIMDSAFAKSGIEKIVVPNGVEQIVSGAFSNCANLTSITLPASLKEIIGYGSILSGCSKLQEVNYLSDINDWVLIDMETGIFTANIIFKINGVAVTHINIDKATEIKPRVFSGLRTVKKLTIGSQVEKIGEFAFCTNYIEEINFSEGLKEIGNNAFQSSLKLKTVDFPKSIEKIGRSAFAYSSNLEAYRLDDGVEMAENVFESCSIKHKTIANGTRAIDAYEYYYSSYKTIYIPNSVEIVQKNIVKDTCIIYVEFEEGQLPSRWDEMYQTSKNIKYGYTYDEYWEEIVKQIYSE